MTDPTPSPGAPVPPDSLVSDWEDDYYEYEPLCSLRKYLASCGAAWGHAQAMQEREKMVALLAKAHDSLRHCGYNTHPQVGQSLLSLAAECHDAAERLKGGGS